MENNKKILINFSLYFLTLLLIIIVGISNVFADTVNVGYITNNTDLLLGIPNLSAPVSLPSGTTNSYGNIYQIWLNINNITINKDYIYNIEISTPSAKLTNINSVSIVSTSQVCNFLGLSDSSTAYTHVYFKCLSNITNGTLSITLENSSGSTDPITTTSSFRWNYTYLSYYTDDNDIDLGPVITNQTQNTQNIINNNNENTNKIIDENKKNFQTCHDSYNLFNPNNVVNGYVSDNTGGLGGVNSSNKNTGYIEIKSNTKYYIFSNKISGNWGAFYDSNKNYISGISSTMFNGTNKAIITSPDNAKYLRFTVSYNNNNNDYANNVMIAESSVELQFEPYGEEICTNKLDEANKTSKGILGKIKDLFNWLTNDDDADVSSAGDTAGWLPPGPIDSIITLPLTMLNNINSSLNKTCSPLNVNLPYVNMSVEIPCLSAIFNQITGLNSFWTWVGLISSVLILYRYLIELYKYYDRLTTLQANFISDWGSI